MKARILISLGAVAATALLTACQSGGPYTPRETVRAGGVEGSWGDAQGVAVSRFANGTFVSTATDTGSKLSEGTYSYRDQNTVEISMTSLIRQTTTQINCALVSPSQLNCTNANGQNFVLTRRSGVS